MELTVLGCAGGIGGRERETTCLWLDDDILLDAGTGLSQLNIQQLVGIDHIFLTHSHLDHVAGLALLLDAVAGKKRYPVTVHATEKVTALLKQHLFNWILWPDFSTIPTSDNPILRWEPIEPGQEITLHGRSIAAHAVNHTHGSVAYSVRKTTTGFLFSGDMCATPALWEAVTHEKGIHQIIVDCSFPNAEADLAAKSMHFCPASLVQDVSAISEPMNFLIYHLKPGQEDAIMQELMQAESIHTFIALQNFDKFNF